MMIYENLINKKDKLAIVGLGYVGMPLAVAFAESLEVIGFDLNQRKIKRYQQGIDETREIGDEKIQSTSVDFTNDEERLNEARFFIVAVPTPIKADKTPELAPVQGADRKSVV